jgi:hypothetical protein
MEACARTKDEAEQKETLGGTCRDMWHTYEPEDTRVPFPRRIYNIFVFY